MANAGHVKVALTTNSLTEVDADFATAKVILFYDVSGSDVTFLDAVQFDGAHGESQRGPGGGAGCSGMDPLGGSSPEALDAKITALKGCGVLFTRKLSDFAAVRIHDGRTFPVNMERKRDVEKVLNHLQHLINEAPPRWLRRRLELADDRAVVELRQA